MKFTTRGRYGLRAAFVLAQGWGGPPVAQGGYTLAKPPEEITVRQVVVALEGDMAIVDCQRGAQCKDADKCATHKVWNRISDAVNGALDAITLKDMLNDYSCAQARGD